MNRQPSPVVGTVTLTRTKVFTVYSETASRTDYVACEPQTVDLRWVDHYWLCARFQGRLSATTFSTGRTVGTPDSASVQWSYAGFSPVDLAEAWFDVALTVGAVEIVGQYGPGTTKPGSPITFYRPQGESND